MPILIEESEGAVQTDAFKAKQYKHFDGQNDDKMTLTHNRKIATLTRWFPDGCSPLCANM